MATKLAPKRARPAEAPSAPGVGPQQWPSRWVRLRATLRKPWVLSLIAACLIAAYLLAIRPLLMPSGRTVWVELTVVSVLTLGAVVSALAVMVTLVTAGGLAASRARRPRSRAWLRKGGRAAVATIASLALLAAVAGSRWLAYTPPIRDAEGNAVPGSIASLEKVDLLGTTQWITVRGATAENPVLLFLAGGPGGTELAMTRGWAGSLEDHFVVVNWDQPGAGKSAGAVEIATLTPGAYVRYARELVLQLRERFGEERIYLMGESWGAALGIMLVQRYPELFHAYVGTAQMVAFLENDTMEYEADLAHAREQGDAALVATLEAMGPPPYLEDPATKMMTLAKAEFSRTEAHTTSDYELMSSILKAPEYGTGEKVRSYFSGLRVFNVVYPQLYDVDFRVETPALEVPVYFFHGRHDVNAMGSLVEDYLRVLDAPQKELIWFERSGHNILPEEPEKVERELVRILDETYPKG